MATTSNASEGTGVAICCFVVWLIFFIAWSFADDNYRWSRNSCNHRVDAFVVDQAYADVHNKCDLTLGWEDAHRRYKETIVRWDCDPTFEDPKRGGDAVAFSKSTCYKDGDDDLRVMDVNNEYDYYDRRFRRFRHHSRHDDRVVSVSEVRHWKRTSIALLVVWVIVIALLGTAVVLTCLCVSPYLLLCEIKKKVRDRNENKKVTVLASPAVELQEGRGQGPPTDNVNMLPRGFIKSDA